MPDDTDPGAGPDRPHRARCNVCGGVVESRHEWDVVSCLCGRLCLSGGRRWRRVNWQADPGASWTDLSDEDATPGPILVLVTGPAGAGKTTLAHALAGAIGCPAICRDELKEGMVHAAGPEYLASPGDALTVRTNAAFFACLTVLLEAGVTTVAEAAFQDRVWRPRVEALPDTVRLRVVRCRVDPAEGYRRMAARGRRPSHADRSVVDDPDYYDRYVPLALGPAVDVDTTRGYDPPLDRIASLVGGA